MRRFWLLLGLLLLPLDEVAAQGVVSQANSVVVGHLPVWAVNRVVRDAGSADGTGPGITELLQINPITPAGTGPDGTHNCFYDGPKTAGYHFLCFDANALGGGLIDYGAANGAPLQQLACRINGNTYSCVNTGNGNVVGPNSSTTGNLAAFNSSNGQLLADFALPISTITKGKIGFWVTDASTNPTVPGHVVTPDNSVVNCAGTTSNCFNETLAKLRTAPNPSIEFAGSGETLANIQITTSGSITVPYLRNQTVHGYGAGIYSTANNLPALTLDSMAEGSFIIEGGQIAGASGTTATAPSAAVQIHPHTTVQPENITAVFSSIIQLGNLSLNTSLGSANQTLFLNMTDGGFIGNTLSAIEVNCTGNGAGGVAAIGALVSAPTPTISFTHNNIHIGTIHQCPGAAWQEGVNAGEGANIWGNIITIDKIAPNGASSTGFSTYASNDTITINVSDEEGPVGTCLTLQSSATNNKVQLDCAAGATTITNGVTLGAGATGNTIAMTGRGTITTLFNDVSGGVNTYSYNGNVIQEFKGVGGTQQFNYQTPTSATNGTLLSGSTNSAGTIQLSGSHSSVQVSFSVTFHAAATCFWQTNQPGTYLSTSASSNTSATAASNIAMPNNALVAYQCHGGA